MKFLYVRIENSNCSNKNRFIKSIYELKEKLILKFMTLHLNLFDFFFNFNNYYISHLIYDLS